MLRGANGSWRDSVRRLFRRLYGSVSKRIIGTLLFPVNYLLSALLKDVKFDNSVLHISYMVHVPYETTRILRKQGMKADYLALGENPLIWDQADYRFIPSPYPFIREWKEFVFFWKVMAKYEIIHSHFAITLSSTGWELPVLKRMDRKLVVHYRGCEIRDRERNMRLHPEMNICQACDYNATICQDPLGKQRRERAAQYGDLCLVTTPDLLDFVPAATHFPFFAPDIDYSDYETGCRRRRQGEGFKIVHVTSHPGIEGTDDIARAIDNLRAKGYSIEFVFLNGVHHNRVLREIAEADLTIGKMKMGYYANAQIESMFLGVPSVTYVRPEFMTEELRESGFIFTSLPDLERTLEYYLSHPTALEKKRELARRSILRLHDNERLGRQLVELYARIKGRPRPGTLESGVDA